MEIARLLVAVDGSVAAAHAFDVASALARRSAMEIALVHVVDPGLAQTAGEVASIDAPEALTEQQAHSLLAPFRARATGSSPPLEFVRTGKPSTEIVAAAREWPADTIVIGARSHGLLHRVLVGSVTAAVLEHAHCPVLVVPPPR